MPKLLDFYATWCGPCRQMTPLVDELATELDGQLTVEKIDIDENMEQAKAHDIRSVPTFILVDESGDVVDRRSGSMSMKDLRDMVRGVLAD